MSMYLKAISIHVYFATIKDSYCLNGKNLEANAKALYALKSTCNAPILRVRRRYCNVYTQGRNTLTYIR